MFVSETPSSLTAPVANRAAVQEAARTSRTHVTHIGRIEAEGGLRLVNAAGRVVPYNWAAFDHFA